MDTSWDSLAIHDDLKIILKNEFQFSSMTPVQSASIPLFLSNKDLIVEAITGSGKTLAFVVPILQLLLQKSAKKNEQIKKYDIFAVVISPTRELAQQIFNVFEIFLNSLNKRNNEFKIKSLLLIGGNNVNNDVKNYANNGANIIVSTPGRLLDMLEKSQIFSTKIRQSLDIFVMDEADQLLNLGFEKTLNEIIDYLPKLRRTSLFSATQTNDMNQLIRVGLRNPVKVAIKEKQSSKCIQMPNRLTNNFIVFQSSEDKLPFLIDFLGKHRSGKILIFLSTCVQVDFFEKILSHYLKTIKILKLHRKLNQNKRKKIYNEFIETNHSLLLCTDIVSRGVDIPQVDWVINFDLPLTIEQYVHRCGRSAHQLNTIGNSLLFCHKHERSFVDHCEAKGVQINEFDEFNNYDLENESNIKFKKSLYDWIRSESRRNINFYQLSTEAFVSFIRTYSTKHIMSKWLFKQLDLNDLANSYGLLVIPKMPELRSLNKSSQTTKFKSNGLDDEKIVKKFKQILYDKKVNTNQANTKNADNKIENTQNQNHCQSGKKRVKSKSSTINELDIDELNDDARMVKKLKRKKITNEEFDQYFGLK